MLEGRELALKNANDAILEIQKFPLQSGFTDDLDALRRLTDACVRLAEAGVDELTREECEEFVEAMKPVLDRLDEMESERKKAARDGGAVGPALMGTSGVRDIKTQCDGAFPVASDFAERATNRAGFKRVEGELAGIKEARAQRRAAQQSDFFGKEAKDYEDAAKNWGIGVLVAVVAFIAVAIAVWYYSGSEDIESGFALVQFLSNRVLLFAALGYGVFFCAKNCFANLHNAVVNRHRQNALATYLDIANVVTDEKHRSTFLSYAAQCIYVPQDSGFTKGNSESGISADAVPPRKG